MTVSGQPRRRVVLGVGNLLLGDDGVGVHAAQALEHRLPPDIEVYDAGTAVLAALDLVDGADDLLVIDAVAAGQTPGTIMVTDGFQALDPAGMPSLHSMGLATALRLVPPERRPATFTVLGVEPHVIGYQTHLSETVRRVLPQVIDSAETIVRGWSPS